MVATCTGCGFVVGEPTNEEGRCELCASAWERDGCKYCGAPPSWMCNCAGPPEGFDKWGEPPGEDD